MRLGFPRINSRRAVALASAPWASVTELVWEVFVLRQANLSDINSDNPNPYRVRQGRLAARSFSVGGGAPPII